MRALRNLSAEDFDNEFGSLYKSIFCEPAADSGPFFQFSWSVVLIPYGSEMEDADARALMVAVKACGDQEVVVKDAETIQPSEAAVVVPVSRNPFEAVSGRPGSNLPFVDVHMFGLSRRWGCVCVASLDDVAIVGGDSEFMARVSVELGGVSSLHDRFLRFAEKEWVIAEGIKQQLLQLAGW